MREQIYNRVLAPGQRLDEAVLAEQLGISRTPLREALKVLDALHEKLEKHAAAGDVNRYYETNYVFHDQL